MIGSLAILVAEIVFLMSSSGFAQYGNSSPGTDATPDYSIPDYVIGTPINSILRGEVPDLEPVSSSPIGTPLQSDLLKGFDALTGGALSNPTPPDQPPRTEQYISVPSGSGKETVITIEYPPGENDPIILTIDEPPKSPLEEDPIYGGIGNFLEFLEQLKPLPTDESEFPVFDAFKEMLP